jgi:hypothetical protein
MTKMIITLALSLLISGCEDMKMDRKAATQKMESADFGRGLPAVSAWAAGNEDRFVLQTGRPRGWV